MLIRYMVFLYATEVIFQEELFPGILGMLHAMKSRNGTEDISLMHVISRLI